MRLLSLFIAYLVTVASWGQSPGFSIDTISDALFATMLGRSYPEGCTVARSDLRHLHVLHYNAEGDVCRGEIVCNKAIADDLLDIFTQLYEAHYPIERIRPIDDYDGDDERSMADNNSSSFCYRSIDGTQRLSRHALGMAIDINTRYNPYVRKRNGKTMISPENGRQYADRSKAFKYKIVEGDLCHRLFLLHGFTWGGAWHTMKDYQHFEKR